MPATGITPTLPITRRPSCPTAVDRGKFGIFAYGIFVALAKSSAKSPRPEPRTKAMRGRNLVLLRMNLAARSARRNSTLGFDFGFAAVTPFFALMKKFRRSQRRADSPWFRPAWRGCRIWRADYAARGQERRY